MRIRIPSLFLLALAAVVACGGAPAPSGTEPPIVLEGTAWRATLVGGEAPSPEHPVTLELSGGRIGGNSGCNSYGADARLQGGRLVVDEVQMTLAACVDPRPGRIEGSFLRILQDSPAVLVDGSRLVLRGSSGEIVLEPAPPAS